MSWSICGEATKTAKLTEDEVRAIIVAKGTVSKIASIFGVSTFTVSQIRNGKAWKHVYAAVMAEQVAS